MLLLIHLNHYHNDDIGNYKYRHYYVIVTMRRSRVDIIIDILEAAREGANKTSIVYKTNLNFKLADEFLNLLQKHSLLENKLDGDKIKYITTVKGKMFLKKTTEISLFLEIPDQTREFWPFVFPSQA